MGVERSNEKENKWVIAGEQSSSTEKIRSIGSTIGQISRLSHMSDHIYKYAVSQIRK